MKKTWLLLIAALLAFGCGERRYEIVNTDDGKAYRLDTKTGEVLYIWGDKSFPVEPANPPEAKR